MINDTSFNLKRISDSIDNLAGSINRYMALQANAELLKCGMISESEFKTAVKTLLRYSTEIRVSHFGKDATGKSK